MYKIEDFEKELSECALFAGISFEEVLGLLECVEPRFETYSKGEIIFAPDRSDDYFGIVLKGSVRGERLDAQGERSVAGAVGQSGVFGEILVGKGGHGAITVVAAADTLALLLSLEAAISGCVAACSRHNALVHNLLGIIGQQYFAQADRLFYITRKTLRAKLEAYLGAVYLGAKNAKFEIPYNREELASFLDADRSALSRELARMREEGILTYRGKSFEILKKDMWPLRWQ